MRALRRVSAAIAAALVAVVLVAAVGSAHETWLQPVGFLIDRPSLQVVHMTSGMGEHYPAPDSPIDPSRVFRSGVWLGDERIPLVGPRKLEHQLALSWTPTKAGTAAIFVELAPRVLNLPDSLIDGYFNEIGASPELRKQWTDTPSPKKWRESYVKHAKTYVRVGDARTAYPWRDDTVMDLEIVPETDPTRIAAGDTLAFRVLYKGKQMPDFNVTVFSEGASKPGFIRTDAVGRARVVKNTPGRILLAGVHLRRVHEPGLEWRSDFTTMTFRVRGRQ